MLISHHTDRLLAFWRDSPLIKTAAGNISLKISAAGMGLLNGILIARLLGPTEFGVYSILMAVVSLSVTLAALGLPPLITREVAVSHAHCQWGLLKGLLITSLRWVLLASLSMVLAGIVLVTIQLPTNSLTLIGWGMAFLLIPLMAFNQLRAATLRGLQWVITADIPDLFLRPLAILILLVTIYPLVSSVDSNNILIIQVAAASIASGVGVWLLAVRLPKEIFEAQAEYTHRHWLKSTGVFLAITILSMFEPQVPLYLLGYLAGTDQAGLYQAAVQAVSMVVIGLGAINMPLQPKLAASWGRNDRAEVQRLLVEAARLATAMAILAAIILLPFAGKILNLFGREYVQAANVLRVLALAQLINALAGSCGLFLMMIGRQAVVLKVFLISVSLVLSTAWLFVIKWGALGAAFSSLIGVTFWNVAFSVYAWRLYRINTTSLAFLTGKQK